MDYPRRQEAPARLYALQLQLRPLERGTLMPFSGKLAHGAWIDWVRHTAPDVATWLHEGNKRRYFTCSSLQFPLVGYRMREAERKNIHLPVDPAKIYTIRLTLLHGELFPLFYDMLVRFQDGGATRSHQPFITLGKQQFLLEQVIANSDNSESWTGFTSLSDLVVEVRQASPRTLSTCALEFASLTTFNRSSLHEGKRISYYAQLPLPQFVFPGLARRWHEIAPPELANLIQEEPIERYIQEEGIIIDDYKLETHQVHFSTHMQKGFLGRCTYQLREELEPAWAPETLSLRQQLHLLARLAFYTGIGYKPAMGLGQSRYLA